MDSGNTRILIHNARRPGHPEAPFRVIIEPPFITATGFGDKPEGSFDREIDAGGALLLPGAIDCHVHFREPGMTRKATIASESRAAVAGGVTSVIDMPNTIPATTTIELWNEKCETARTGSLANYAFFLGAASDNFNVLRNADYTRIPGVKVFMGSSTGTLLVDDNNLLCRILRDVPALIAVHAEDNARIAGRAAIFAHSEVAEVAMETHSAIRDSKSCYDATERAILAARLYDTRLHVCHVSTADELSLLDRTGAKTAEKRITAEVSPHHLLFTTADYSRLGSRIKMNPSIKGMRDRIALRTALENGIIDMVATDHAPHLLSEKQGDARTAMSGAPMVQFALPVLLSLYDSETAERVYCRRPAEVYGISRRGRLGPGYYADLCLVQEVEPYEVTDEMVISPCGWTPLAGTTLRHRVVSTWVNGTEVFTARSNAEAGGQLPIKGTPTSQFPTEGTPTSMPLLFRH